MPSIDNNYNFNLEDKIRWEEWAPSLQDKLKYIWNELQASSAYLDERLGDIRITIGENPPLYPIPYNELWFDTRYMVARIFTESGWHMTHAAWYGGSNDDIYDEVDSPLSHNPDTNCHCYTIGWTSQEYCHCKSQMWEDTEPEDSLTDMSFNQSIPNPVSAKKYRFELYGNAPSSGMDIMLQTLNVATNLYPNNGITPSYEINRVLDENGVSVDYVITDEQYDPIFDDDSSTFYTVNNGYTYIDFTFGQMTTVTKIYGRLIPYSSGPLYINVQYQTSTSTEWINLFNNVIDGITTGIKLKGNYIPYSVCHSSCHCARW